MFTGIVTALGTVREVQPIGAGHDARFVIGVAPAFLAEVNEAKPAEGEAAAAVAVVASDAGSPGGGKRARGALRACVCV